MSACSSALPRPWRLKPGWLGRKRSNRGLNDAHEAPHGSGHTLCLAYNPNHAHFLTLALSRSFAVFPPLFAAFFTFTLCFTGQALCIITVLSKTPKESIEISCSL